MAISVFDLFKVGIGPSSSHTVGPMRAAATFAQALTDQQVLSQTRRVEVRLYGSLSATGVGHATDRACVMGLMGEWPDRVDPTSINGRIQQLRESGRLLLAGQQEIAFNWHTDLLLLDESLPYHPNAMSLHAYGDTGLLSEQTYYSVGGGFIIEAAEAASGIAPTSDVQLPYDFSSAVELLALCNKHGLRVSELMMANERAWRSDEEIRSGLLHIWSVMRECVEQGLRDVRHPARWPGCAASRREIASQPVGNRQAQRDHLDLVGDGMGQPVRPRRQRRKRRRRAHGHRADQWRGRDHPRRAALLHEVQRRRV